MNERLAAIVLSVCVLAGCATSRPPPVNVKNSQADFHADTWDCQKQIAGLARPPSATAPAERTDRVTRCSAAGVGEIECRSSDQRASGTAVEGVLAGMAMRSAGQADQLAASAMSNCMMAKGWRY